MRWAGVLLRDEDVIELVAWTPGGLITAGAMLGGSRAAGASRDRSSPLLVPATATTATGRTDPTQLTLYKSVGVAVQDAAAAAQVLAAARAQGIGVEVEL